MRGVGMEFEYLAFFSFLKLNYIESMYVYCGLYTKRSRWAVIDVQLLGGRLAASLSSLHLLDVVGALGPVQQPHVHIHRHPRGYQKSATNIPRTPDNKGRQLTDQEPRQVELEDEHPLHLPRVPLPPPAVVDAGQSRERALHPEDDAHELQRGGGPARAGGEEAAQDPDDGGELEGELEEGVEAEEARLGGPGGEEVEVLVGGGVEGAEGVEGVEGGGGGDPEGVGEEVDEVDG